MKGTMRKIVALVLTLAMVMSMTAVTSFAAEEANILEGEKTSVRIDGATDQYKVTVQVPGGDGVEKHDEVILMVDGSYSLDEEWPQMKEFLVEVAEKVLNGNGNTVLTLMAFGMGDNEVIVHAKTPEEVEAYLGDLPGTLLYGRSSTNCEAGFTGVENYINNHDSSLNNAYVIYISDGRVNTDETPRDFYNNWEKFATRFGPLTVAQAAFECTLTYGENLPEAFKTVFGDRFDDAADFEEIMKRGFEGEVTNEEFIAFADQVWKDVYAYSGLDLNKEYPISVVERAFVKYDKEHGTFIQDALYYTTYGSDYVKYPEGSTRAAAAADRLAGNDKVQQMYVVDYDAASAWMDTGITSEKSSFVKSDGIGGLLEALDGTITTIVTTPYNNVSVTDYMSKWVNLNPESIKVYEKDVVVAEFDAENSDVENGVYKYKWTNGFSYEGKDPIVLELVPAAEYEAGGEEVVGNENGDIYKITWNIKEGALVRSDSYRMEYEVTVDTEETGFEYNTEYPANGNTDVHYEDEVGEPVDNEIDVPNVDYPRADLPEDEFLEEDTEDGTEEDGTGADLPDDQYLEEEPVDEAGDDAAQTGDDTPMGALLAVAIAALAAMVALRKKGSVK